MHLSKLVAILGGTLLLSACAGSQATTRHQPRGFWQPNRSDRQGREQGRWRTYYDSADAQPFTAGRYRHGRPVRTFRYYAPTGQLDHSERYRHEGFCEVTYWHPGGKVARRGPAQWVTSGDKPARFFWYGEWKTYDPDGQTTGVHTYTDGTLTRAETYEQGQLIQVETYRGNNVTRTETYAAGKLIKVETFEKGLRTSTTKSL